MTAADRRASLTLPLNDSDPQPVTVADVPAAGQTAGSTVVGRLITWTFGCRVTGALKFTSARSALYVDLSQLG